MTTARLKPCPFCGGAVTIYGSYTKHAYIIEHKTINDCAFYGFDIPWEIAKSMDRAKEMWNRRDANE